MADTGNLTYMYYNAQKEQDRLTSSTPTLTLTQEPFRSVVVVLSLRLCYTIASHTDSNADSTYITVN